MRASEAFIDTNLFVLLIVGSVDRGHPFPLSAPTG